jgi:LysR family transcriptional regulator, carnitine catabolism transcriptional activator
MRTSLATLRVFAAVAETGNIRLAAEQLGRTPSAISERLKQFEQEIGAPLFESGRKNRLTPVGSYVQTQVRDLLSHVDLKLASLQAYSRNAIGRIDIASVPSIATTILPGVIARFRGQWPAVEITARDADSRSVADLVQSGTVELGIASMSGERRALRFVPLFEEPLGIVCRRNDPLYRMRGARRWSDLRGRTLLANAISDGYEVDPAVPPAQAPIVVYNVLSLLALVRAKIGITILPRLSVSEAQTDIGFIPIDEPDAKRTVGVITRTGEALSPAAAALLQIVRQQIREIAGDFAITLCETETLGEPR